MGKEGGERKEEERDIEKGGRGREREREIPICCSTHP